ncbi:hypothetical protein Ahy_B03g062787 [Arachis hypogaea]|uniref:Uncharacterized protein n=1 Tax=Arachis hypogaea TaxID=3818 RepID=A0A444ZVI8_ARAHY|nr:hypothetical protein Ahy_B03g062787 [Arachis hypogaea]
MALTIQEHVAHNNLYSLIEKTSVQSHFEYSKLCINSDLEEVRDFRNRRLSGKPTKSAKISQVSSHGPRSGADELKKGNVAVKTIEEAISSTQARTIIEVMACNGTGSITLLMWDRKMAFDGDGYPPALETMMDKKLLFKVNVKSSNIKSPLML